MLPPNGGIGRVMWEGSAFTALPLPTIFAGVCMWERECGSIKLRLRFIKLQDLEKSDWFFAGTGERSLRLRFVCPNYIRFQFKQISLCFLCARAAVFCFFGCLRFQSFFLCNGRIMKIVSYFKVPGEYGTAWLQKSMMNTLRPLADPHAAILRPNWFVLFGVNLDNARIFKRIRVDAWSAWCRIFTFCAYHFKPSACEYILGWHTTHFWPSNSCSVFHRFFRILASNSISSNQYPLISAMRCAAKQSEWTSKKRV